MTIDDLHYRDFVLVEIGMGSDWGMGFIQSVDEIHRTVTFSKFDVLTKKKNNFEFKGVIENMTLNFSEDRFIPSSAHKYFCICRDHRLRPNFTIEDFFFNGDLIDTGIRVPLDRDGAPWNFIGFVNRAEFHRDDFGSSHRIYIDNPVYYRRSELFDDIEIRPYNKEMFLGFNHDHNRFSIRNNTVLLHNEEIVERLKTFETCREYTIQGMIP